MSTIAILFRKGTGVYDHVISQFALCERLVGDALDLDGVPVLQRLRFIDALRSVDPDGFSVQAPRPAVFDQILRDLDALRKRMRSESN